MTTLKDILKQMQCHQTFVVIFFWRTIFGGGMNIMDSTNSFGENANSNPSNNQGSPTTLRKWLGQCPILGNYIKNNDHCVSMRYHLIICEHKLRTHRTHGLQRLLGTFWERHGFQGKWGFDICLKNLETQTFVKQLVRYFLAKGPKLPPDILKTFGVVFGSL